MSLRTNQIIDAIISAKAANDPKLERIIMAKLILHGIYPKRLAAEAEDDPLVLAKLERLAKEL